MNMILMNDFKAEPAELREAMINAATRVIDSGWYILGKEVSQFEQHWAQHCGLPYGIGVGNGMDAIEITLRALNIGVGDEVITTPMTAFATVLAIIRAGAIPVLADIEPDSALMSLESAARCLTPRTKAVVLVHLYGQVRDMNSWGKFCETHKLTLIEDCAQAHSATSAGKVAGSFGSAGAYSFYPTKNLGALGDAGMIVTGSQDVAERAARIRNYGQSTRYSHPVLGLNSRLDELHAAMLCERLKWLDEFTRRRQQIAQTYLSEINHPAVSCLARPEQQGSHVYHLFVVTCTNRDGLQKHLLDRGIQTLIHYPIPVHRQEPCNDIARDPHGLSASEQHAATCLSIPCHPQMSELEVSEVVDAMNSFRDC